MYLYFDIETVPGPIKPTIEEVMALAPKSMTKEDTIRKWAEENVETVYRKQALDSMQGEICCIGLAFDDERPTTFVGPETMVIEHAATMIDFRMSKYGSMRPIWVGHNARAFDLPWLWRKALKYRHYELAQRIPRERYSKDVEDTMEMWSTDYKDYVSLDAVAKFLGVGGKSGHGSQVYDLWRTGRHQEIADYCADDVELVRRVHKVLTMQSTEQMDVINF